MVTEVVLNFCTEVVPNFYTEVEPNFHTEVVLDFCTDESRILRGACSNVCLYDLRHNYATQNMLMIKGDSDMLDQITYLSMSMGHSSVNATLRYADLTPQLADKIREQAGEAFNRIVPEVDYEVE